MEKRVIISISSDFGTALAKDWLSQGHKVSGTYRTNTLPLEELSRNGAVLHYCDISDNKSIDLACAEIGKEKWDVLCIAPASLDPIGLFPDVDIDAWEKSVALNFTAQMRVVHRMLPYRNTVSKLGPIVLLFAGGGTNNATKYYSAYTISKIAQIKMTELLDAEVPDTRFTIIGPGWVKTKIHEATLKAGEKAAGENYQKTIVKLTDKMDADISKVTECCNWAIAAEKEIVSGRNFSLVNDKWGSEDLENQLLSDSNMYKLRRSGN